MDIQCDGADKCCLYSGRINSLADVGKMIASDDVSSTALKVQFLYTDLQWNGFKLTF